jgi:hypothetical protein
VGIPLFFLKNWVGLTHLTLNRPFLESVSLKNYLKTDTFTTLVKRVPTTVNERLEHIIRIPQLCVRTLLSMPLSSGGLSNNQNRLVVPVTTSKNPSFS